MASMELSRLFHRAYTARLWRFHGVLFILQRFRGVCKALSRRSWRSRGASTASYGVLMIKALKKMNKKICKFYHKSKQTTI